MRFEADDSLIEDDHDTQHRSVASKLESKTLHAAETAIQHAFQQTSKHAVSAFQETRQLVHSIANSEANLMMESSAKGIATLVILIVSFLLITVVKARKIRVDDDDDEPPPQQPKGKDLPLLGEADASDADEAAGSVHTAQVAKVDDGRNGSIQSDSEHPISYLAFGRVKDRHVLAAWHPEIEEDTIAEAEDTFEKLLKAGKAKLKPGDKNKLKAKGGMEVYFFMEADGEFMTCAAITDSTYQDKFAYQLLSDLMKAGKKMDTAHTCKEGQLTESLSEPMNELHSKYKKPLEASALGKTLSKMHDVEHTMGDNKQTAEQTQAQMQDLEHSTTNLDHLADKFDKHSEAAVAKEQWERTKQCIIFSTFVFDVVSLFVIWVIL